ncbi:KH domain-containing protein [bacterium]|nr:KH domain-containing protein [candidate division CSSED10-310 bacterium]
MMEELIRLIATKIVDNPEMVQVSEIRGEHTNVIELKVAEDDIGKIIGKKGNTISAIRTILNNAGMKQNKRYILEILE